MKRLMVFSIVLLIAFSLMSCNDSESSSEAGGPVELDFMFWGSLVEKTEVERCVENYNQMNEGKIHVTPQHVPDDYINKMASMIVGGTAPDIAYLDGNVGPTYAMENRILFVEDLMGDDKSFLETIIPDAQWRINGKVAFFSVAIELMFISYNRDIFDRLNVPYPPSKFEDALSWDEFVDLCQRVTIDSNGNNAKSPDFDPNSIMTYGLSLTPYLSHIFPLVYSNGGSILNADSTNTAFDTPAWIDTMNKINDLIYKYHVVPNPAAADTLAAEAMLTGQVAMTCDGNWSLMDYHDQGLNVGMGVFPDLGRGPFTMNAPGVTAIFSSTEHPQEAWDFYKYSLDPENGPTNLFVNGLWQPVYSRYYAEPDKISLWIDNRAHPKEYHDVVIANIDRNIVQMPQTYINRWGDLLNYLTPAVEAVFGAPGDSAGILREAQNLITSTNAYTGRFDQ